jgi:ribosomal protein L35
MKQKNNSSAKKRFKRTAGGKGKLMQAKSSKNHLLTNKSKRAKSTFEKGMPVSDTNVKRIRKALPYL